MKTIEKEMQFHDKKGNLTNYALACGYVQDENGWRLYKEGNCFHVRKAFDQWESFDTLTEAREFLSTQ